MISFGGTAAQYRDRLQKLAFDSVTIYKRIVYVVKLTTVSYGFIVQISLTTHFVNLLTPDYEAYLLIHTNDINMMLNT